jgi:hypothetical protein
MDIVYTSQGFAGRVLYRKGSAMEPKHCEVCGILFSPSYKVSKKYWAKRRFCSDICKGIGHHPPVQTGKETPLDVRLWRRVEKKGPDECWLWTGITDACGYGMLRRGGSTPGWHKAHRLAYTLSVGPIPEGLHVLHRCDCPACCNPQHLWVGTHADNMRDRDAKGRCGAKGGHVADRRGLKNGHARLSDETIKAIQTLYDTGEWSQVALAAMFHCGQSHISRIIRGEQRLPVTTPWTKPERSEGG